MTTVVAGTPDATVTETPVVLRKDLQSTFHLVVVASQRAKQLAAGARPRVDPGAHRHARVALLEVSAGLVSWTLMEEKGGAAKDKDKEKEK
jgi:DNA-directed RNA polymerase omega subunit